MPKKALTDAVVKRLTSPAKGQVDYFDRGYPGLALRLSYGGGRSWVFFYRTGGKLRRMTLGTYPALGLAEAREAWREARENAQAGRDPAKKRNAASSPTDFKGVAAQWILRDQSKNKSRTIVARLIDVNVLPAWEHRQITDISRRDVLDVIDVIVDRGAVITARRVQAHLHRLFRWAVGRGIVVTSPVSDLPKPGSEIKRDRVLTDDELMAVWHSADGIAWQFRDAIRILILTGARREEIGRLKWSEVNLEERMISLAGARTKNGLPHSIPLSPAAVTILENLPRINKSDYIFTIDGAKHVSGWSRAKARLDKDAGIEPWRIHDLRRTVATGLQKLRTPLQVTEAVLGHIAGSRAGIVGVYQRHDYADEKRVALEAWAGHIEALLGKGANNVVRLSSGT